MFMVYLTKTRENLGYLFCDPSSIYIIKNQQPVQCTPLNEQLSHADSTQYLRHNKHTGFSL